MENIKSFDAIIGYDTLEELRAVIDIPRNKLIIDGTHIIPLLHYNLQQVNKIEVRDEHLTEIQREKLSKMLDRFKTLFQPPENKLPFTTRIQAEIRTTDNTPVYSKLYPYPQSLKQEVETQISKLLKDGIIRPSKSPYNSPIWVVKKKQDASKINKYRVVMDYRKLNSKTISDKYPIPDTSTVLANLGKSKYFTTLDLNSGFHQIPMAESDIEKTAFSINNGKYEFVRLPFGLKNGPSIFQRVMDDVLRDHIGTICHVYIDDIIVLGETFEQHLLNLETILNTLKNANFCIQPDKSEFCKKEVEFLGFIVTQNGLKPNPKKVEAIKNYPKPSNIKELRAFLGLSGYYRRFIKGYAALAKPLTNMLRGKEGHLSRNESKKINITLDDHALLAFNTLKEVLCSEDVLIFPDFNKPFILNTDASNQALGAVLSQRTCQGERPISFISKSLSKTEENYATNEKEMLAIVWALNVFRNFIYGAKILIYTDHMPLTYAISPKNVNAKLKRWKSYIEEHDHEIFYKKGKSNHVADALSRIQINSLTSTAHSADNDDNSYIFSTESPVNVFRNQLIFETASQSGYTFSILFGTHKRHLFKEPKFTKDFLEKQLKAYLKPNCLNGIMCSEPVMGTIQEIYKENFNPKITKARYTQRKVNDISNKDDQIKIIKETHFYAHRNAKENVAQIIKNNYFPGMNKLTREYVKTCDICKIEKYDRHPQKSLPVKTQVPYYPGEIIHIDIFVYNQNNCFISSIDKFSKFVKIKQIKSKSIADIHRPIIELLYDWDIPKIIVMDNERSFTSQIIEQQIRELGVEISKTPVNHSESNGQIERAHSTIREIMRCSRNTSPNLNLNDLLQIAIHKYNNSIHSVTGDTPKNIYTGINRDNLSIPQFQEQRKKTLENIINKFKTMNDKIKEPKYRKYTPGQFAYEKIKSVSKRDPFYKKVKVKENHLTFIIDEENRKIHKCNLRKE
uniref:Polyprotein n=1 Tax=Chuta errantivirus TaxID=3078401 RepID=A0AB38Z1M6_9VIRU